MSSENKPKVAFFENLEMAIKSSGLSKKELAERLGIAPQALTKYLKGRIPGGEILANMSLVLQVSTDSLLGISQMADEKWKDRALKAEAKLEKLQEVLPLISQANTILSSIVAK